MNKNIHYNCSLDPTKRFDYDKIRARNYFISTLLS